MARVRRGWVRSPTCTEPFSEVTHDDTLQFRLDSKRDVKASEPLERPDAIACADDEDQTAEQLKNPHTLSRTNHQSVTSFV